MVVDGGGGVVVLLLLDGGGGLDSAATVRRWWWFGCSDGRRETVFIGGDLDTEASVEPSGLTGDDVSGDGESPL